MTARTQSSTDVGELVLATVPTVLSAPSLLEAVVLQALTFIAVAIVGPYRLWASTPLSGPIGA